MEYPYNDNEMIYDENLNQYILTEKCLLNMGIDLRSRLAGRKAVSPEMLIQQLLSTTSEQIYSYIHEFNADNTTQDKIIAKCPSARLIIYRALKQQVIHLIFNGNLFYSIKPEERATAINDVAKQILNTTITEIGVSILYTGRY